MADFPVAKAMPLMNFKKLVPKVYEAVVCEFYSQSNQRGKTRRDRPRLFDFVEDSLIREYGLKSLSRKTLLQVVHAAAVVAAVLPLVLEPGGAVIHSSITLIHPAPLQMVATVHIHHGKDSRVRMFAELASIIPSDKTSIETCGGCAEDFFFWFLSKVSLTASQPPSPLRAPTEAVGYNSWFMSKVYADNPKKLSESMSSVRTNFVLLEVAVRHVMCLYPPDPGGEVEHGLRADLMALSKIDKNETCIVPIDEFLEHVLGVRPPTRVATLRSVAISIEAR